MHPSEHKPNSEILLYQTEDGQTRLEELFQRDKSVISRHIKNIIEEGELEQDRVVANFATTCLE